MVYSHSLSGAIASLVGAVITAIYFFGSISRLKKAPDETLTEEELKLKRKLIHEQKTAIRIEKYAMIGIFIFMLVVIIGTVSVVGYILSRAQ